MGLRRFKRKSNGAMFDAIKSGQKKTAIPRAHMLQLIPIFDRRGLDVTRITMQNFRVTERDVEFNYRRVSTEEYTTLPDGRVDGGLGYDRKRIEFNRGEKFVFEDGDFDSAAHR